MDDWVERELSQLAADGGRLMPAICRAGSCVRTRCGLGQAALRQKRWRGARCLAMTEIKLWRTPHSAFSIPHLNGSFPVFSLEWTIGGNGVESMQLEICLAHSWSFLRHVGKPNAVQANQSLMHYENQT